LHIQRATAALNMTPGAPQACEVRLLGEVTVPAAFAVAKSLITFQLGDRKVALPPAVDGRAQTEDVSFRSLNSGRYGMVGDGLMQFTATLRGPAWLEELKKAGVVGPGGLVPDKSIELKIQIGEAQHTATVRLVSP
jgi:hypothetical protein